MTFEFHQLVPILLTFTVDWLIEYTVYKTINDLLK